MLLPPQPKLEDPSKQPESLSFKETGHLVKKSKCGYFCPYPPVHLPLELSIRSQPHFLRENTPPTTAIHVPKDLTADSSEQSKRPRLFCEPAKTLTGLRPKYFFPLHRSFNSRAHQVASNWLGLNDNRKLSHWSRFSPGLARFLRQTLPFCCLPSDYSYGHQELFML